MSENKTLFQAFKETALKTNGHGDRNAGILVAAFDQTASDMESDIYGHGKIIEDFQDKMAKLLGKESAVFFPSGTMAQQIALRIWCDEKGLKRAAYHPLSHLEIHEEDGIKELHGIETLLLAEEDRVITLEDIQNMKEEVAVVLLELPQREIGGQLPDFETLQAISAYCRKQGIKLHLDGARLLEVLPFYQKSAAEICDLFDSVYLSLYKGVGGIAGAVLAGSEPFTKKSKVWKRRHGGDLISLYPYIVSADYYYDLRADKMERYYQGARELAKYYNSCERVSTLPEVPVSNMFHVHFGITKESLEPVLIEVYEKYGVGLTGYLRETDDSSCYYEVSIGDLYETIPDEKLKEVFISLNEKLKAI
ncbi:low specificity L-threonine aldolase [Rossellomorea vietnamensis]|uniref:Low specificity L-threonine aldolase n=1 Tax=Rossellomorea vietnamensis TaxID=218284 RepID=A0A5D4MF86_9BACI|nr:aminotransferase class I/II-fold pyridoxal phosphate-dependent enzyme [Rossellomorea vietnamensis]TYR99993.1 low specificity L-threonine aldolase [Rossellomorea vietnamensis]